MLNIDLMKPEDRAQVSENDLRSTLIESAAAIYNNEGRLTPGSSAHLDMALDIFDAALAEHVRRQSP